MALLNIVKDPDPELRLKAKPVTLPLTKEKRDLILSMVDYLKKSQDEEYAKKNQIRPGVGIAAPQIGVSERFYAIYMDDEDKHYEYGTCESGHSFFERKESLSGCRRRMPIRSEGRRRLRLPLPPCDHQSL
jgi:peptide deformylase